MLVGLILEKECALIVSLILEKEGALLVGMVVLELEECALLVDLLHLDDGALRFAVDCLVGTFTATLGCFGLG